MQRNPVLPQSLKQADFFRKNSRWADAIENYAVAERQLPKEAGIKHNMALCYFALNDAASALRYADLAIALNAALWQSQLLKVKSLRKLGMNDQAIALLEKITQQFPSSAEARQELASLAMDEWGDAALAIELVQPITGSPRHAKNTRLTELMARLYIPCRSAEELSTDLRGFAEEHLERPMIALPDFSSGRNSVKKRVGLISPQFCCSPVYFFCIGALKHIASDFDLVILNRGHRNDWATGEFRSLAREWFDVASMDSGSLSAFIARQDLDVLIDMGGWMDVAALSAISAKPAKRLFKWVGGQAATTGISAFDGFFTDRYQSLPEHQHLYVEPLIFLECGYVTYTPPSYMPDPVMPQEPGIFGVIANPVKVSHEFLVFLKNAIEAYLDREGEKVSLRFIDRRYCHERLRLRIAAALQPDSLRKRERLRIDFVVPKGHRDYLDEIGKLTAVLDTFPYTGGLTTVEALWLGVPCITWAGTLFSERHSYSHCRYAGIEPELYDGEKNLSEMLHFYHHEWHAEGQRSSLISRSSGRQDHQALARSITRYF